jgi:hypothetical protein
MIISPSLVKILDAVTEVKSSIVPEITVLWNVPLVFVN